MTGLLKAVHFVNNESSGAAWSLVSLSFADFVHRSGLYNSLLGATNLTSRIGKFIKYDGCLSSHRIHACPIPGPGHQHWYPGASSAGSESTNKMRRRTGRQRVTEQLISISYLPINIVYKQTWVYSTAPCFMVWHQSSGSLHIHHRQEHISNIL